MYLKNFLKYCPKCKNNLFQKNNFFFCQYCDFYFYQNPIPTNGLIIYNEKKEILLVQRKYPPKKNYWDISGGFVDLNENIEQSIAREINEELNIKINSKNLKYLTSVNDKYTYKKITHYTLCFIFTYKLEKNFEKIKAKDDVKKIKWFKEKNLPWDKIAFEGVKKSLKLFFASF